jgi:excisionase family DNA binding protein
MDTTDMLTLQEVAEYLKIAPKTVMRMIVHNEIPTTKVAGQWRCKKSEIDLWLNAKLNYSKGHEFPLHMDTPGTVLQLSRQLKEPFMLFDLQTSGIEDTLWALTAPLQAKGYTLDRKALVQQLLSREETVTTAFGEGTAFPHLQDIQQVPTGLPPIIMGISKKGIAFGNQDGELTHIFFLLLIPNKTMHLHILSRLARFSLKKGVRERLIRSSNPIQVILMLLEDDYETMPLPNP